MDAEFTACLHFLYFEVGLYIVIPRERNTFVIAVLSCKNHTLNNKYTSNIRKCDAIIYDTFPSPNSSFNSFCEILIITQHAWISFLQFSCF